MRRKASIIPILLLFAAGVCILLYPLISEWLGGHARSTVIENYGNAVQELDEKEFAALKQAAGEYNEGLLGNVVLTDPFDEKAAAEASAAYESLLNISEDGVMGAVRIPKIKVTLPVYHGTSNEVLEKGAGHLENTSLPVGGAGTHAVISAHSGLPTATLFTDLTKLIEGDLFFLEVLDETLAYRVDQIKIVKPEDTSDLLIDSTQDYVTLVTCTPYGINSHRLLVRGVCTEYEETLEQEAAREEPAAGNPWNRPYMAAGIVFVLLLVLYAVGRLRRKKRGKHAAH